MVMELQAEKYLIRRIQGGDRDAFGKLVDAYSDLVYTLCLRMLHAEAEAEEAAQDIFIKAFRSLSSFQEKARFSTWLYRIAYNHCISVIRKKVRMIDLVDDVPDMEPDESSLSGLDLISGEERSRYLKKALDSLGETDAVVVTLFYLEEMSLNEIAEITALSGSNIRIKLHRARKKMYDVISKELKTEISSIL